MKKRKSPVVLITVLVIMLVAVGIMYSPRGSDQSAMAQPPPPSAETGERPKISPTDVASMAKSSMAPQAKGGNRPAPIDAPDQPSIAVPQSSVSKPMPSDSNISTQWYTDSAKK